MLRSLRQRVLTPARVRSLVTINTRRLEAMQQAEIVHFCSEHPPRPRTLNEICAYKDATEFRKYLLDELPRRYAQRIGTMERLPRWNEFPAMRAIRNIYVDAFKKLRGIKVQEASRFRSSVIDIQRACSNMPERIVPAVRAMKNKTGLSNEVVNAFLDDFLIQRIGTEVLSAEYIGLTRPGRPTSVINLDCDPCEVVEAAARDATQLCRHHYGFAPPVDITRIGDVRLPFLARYLEYIMLELLKNALRATAEKHDEMGCEKNPIIVHVVADDECIMIRVRDRGVGIDPYDIAKTFDYMYTTAKPQGEDPDDLYSGGGVAPIAGFGCGLPLSRNYARYVGGGLELNSIHPVGTDVALYLDRTANQTEQVV